jgi:dihydropteroate synthase
VLDEEAALEFALRMERAGAAMIDCGAESTRPGAARVDARTQIDRLSLLTQATADIEQLRVPLCVDSTLSEVAANFVGCYMHAINDVSAGLEDPDMFRVAAERGCGLVLMHRALPPERDSYSDRYAAAPISGDVVGQVRDFLLERAIAAVDAGVDHERICLDPGFGFGKTVEQNLELMRGIDAIVTLGFPVLVGLSRKSFIGRISSPDRDTTPDERLPGTLAAALALADRGVRLFRVHDVAEHVAAFRVWSALRAGEGL